MAASAAVVLLVSGCGGSSSETTIADRFELAERQLSERGGGDTTRLVVGSKNFDEQAVLGQITLQALEAAGAEVVDATGTGGTEAVRQALVTEEIDMYWEYTGTGALILLAQSDPPDDPKTLYRDVARLDAEQNGIEWLAPGPANSTYALAVRSDTEDADVGDVRRLSDLGDLIEQSPEKATICVGPEFSERADGLPGLEEEYGFSFPRANVFVLPDSTVYGAVESGDKCSFGSVFETSGYVPQLGLRLLEDDRGFFPAYNPSLTMRAETLEDNPALEPLFADIAERLDTETLRELSGQVSIERREPEDVAEEWLRSEGLVD